MNNQKDKCLGRLPPSKSGQENPLGVTLPSLEEVKAAHKKAKEEKAKKKQKRKQGKANSKKAKPKKATKAGKTNAKTGAKGRSTGKTPRNPSKKGGKGRKDGDADVGAESLEENSSVQSSNDSDATNQVQTGASANQSAQPSAMVKWLRVPTVRIDKQDEYGCPHMGIEQVMDVGRIDNNKYKFYITEGEYLSGKKCKGCGMPAENFKDKLDKNGLPWTGGKMVCYACDKGVLAHSWEPSNPKRKEIECDTGVWCRVCAEDRRNEKWNQAGTSKRASRRRTGA